MVVIPFYLKVPVDFPTDLFVPELNNRIIYWFAQDILEDLKDRIYVNNSKIESVGRNKQS